MTPSERRGLGVSRIANARQIWPTHCTPARRAWAGNGDAILHDRELSKPEDPKAIHQIVEEYR